MLELCEGDVRVKSYFDKRNIKNRTKILFKHFSTLIHSGSLKGTQAVGFCIP